MSGMNKRSTDPRADQKKMDVASKAMLDKIKIPALSRGTTMKMKK